MVGEWLGLTKLRAYLTGPLCLESGERLLPEAALPGPQGRHLLGFLIAEHARPLSRDELADQLWPAALPAAWENSLKSLISKIRAALTHAGLPGTSLARFLGAEVEGMGPGSLAGDFNRFRFLLGATDGEGVFTPDEQ